MIKNNSNKHLNQNQPNNAIKSKSNQKPKSRSVIKQFFHNKTIKNYIENLFDKKKVIQSVHVSTGFGSSTNSHYHQSNNHYQHNHFDHIETKEINTQGISKSNSKKRQIIPCLYSRPQMSHSKSRQPLTTDINYFLLKRIVHLKQENDQLKIENKSYKRLFSELENGNREKRELGICTLSSKSNKDTT